MKWEIKQTFKKNNSSPSIDDVLSLLLGNRGITEEKKKNEFLYPKLEDVTASNVGIEKKVLAKAVARIKKAIADKEQIVVFGDYDVDGICASAILWETLHHLGANIMPYIPHRVDEGYGLSSKGISNVLLQIPSVKLIITVDNGIVANEAVDFAREQGIDVIITDHHLPHEDDAHQLPNAFAIVHTTKLCGAGVAWVLAKEFLNDEEKLVQLHKTDHLVFAALATIADMVPLIDANRAIVRYGLSELRKTRRLGLRALFEEAGIDQANLQTYQVGHMISPRLNAAGRMESAMDSLRLLCTRDPKRARELADALGEVNKFRQQEMILATEHAMSKIANAKSQMAKLLFIADESYPQGVIGLVAGKLVEKYYRPAIVIAIGETHSKASVRSIKGFNIIEFLRTHTDHFVNVGGHPMAAGFTVETVKITLLQQSLEKAADKILSEGHFVRAISIDTALPLAMVSQELHHALQALAPFGMGNPEPVFSSKVIVKDVRIMGKDGKHLKLKLSAKNEERREVVEAVGFGMGERSKELKVGDEIEVAYIIDENEWNGRKNLQLKLKDIKKS